MQTTESTAMTTGERRFYTGEGEKIQSGLPPVAAGTYKALIRPNTATAKLPKPKGDEPQTDKIPYVTFQLELLGTAVKEGGKNRVVFPMLFLSTHPDDYGQVQANKASSVLGLKLALGASMNVGEEVRQDSKGNTQTFLNANEVCEWVQSHAGEEFTVRIGVKDDRNEVKAYVDAKMA